MKIIPSSSPNKILSFFVLVIVFAVEFIGIARITSYFFISYRIILLFWVETKKVPLSNSRNDTVP